MTSDIRYMLDPVLWAKEQLGFIADPWQVRVLESQKNTIINVHRQGGKTGCCAIASLHKSLFFPSSTTLLISPTLRQSILIAQKITDFINSMKPRPELVTDSVTVMQFKNGSRITSLPGNNSDTVRGFSCDLLLIDESARIADELYITLRPMLAVSGGRIVMCSTPAARRGVFFHEWTEGGNEWLRIEVPASECPRISPAFLSEELAALGSRAYDQEYFCQFNDVMSSCFSYDEICAAMSDDIEPLFPVISADCVRYIPDRNPIDSTIKPLFEDEET